MALPLLGPPLMARSGLSPESIGYVSALTSGGISWFLACGGPMLGHFGAVRSLQIGLACMAAGLLLMAQPVGLVALLGALAIGFGCGPNTPAGSQILIRTAPARHRTLIFSIKQAGVPLGGALAGLAIAPLVQHHGLQAALWTITGVTLVSILLVQPFRRRLDAPAGTTPAPAPTASWGRALFSPRVFARSLGVLRSHPSLPLLTALGASYSTMQACLMAFTATYAITRHGATLAEAGGIVAVMQFSSMIGRVLMGWVADRRGRALRHLALQALASAAAVALLLVAGGAGGLALYACAALVGFTAIGWNGVHIAELARVAPLPLVSDVTSAASLFGFLGSITGPLAFAWLVGWSGSYELAFLAAALQLALFGAISFLVLRRDTTAKGDDR